MDKERMRSLVAEKLGDYAELGMPHELFVEFSNHIKDGVPTQVVFVDDLTGDIYAPDDLIRMTYFTAEEQDTLLN